MYTSNKNKTEQEVTEQLEYEYIAGQKTKKRKKVKTKKKISFAQFKLGKNGRLEEELTHNGLIKRAFRNWSKQTNSPVCAN